MEKSVGPEIRNCVMASTIPMVHDDLKEPNCTQKTPFNYSCCSTKSSIPIT